MERIEIVHENTVVCTLSFQDTQWINDGYLIKDLTGITGIKSSLSISEYTTLDGGEYVNARADVRDVQLTMYISEVPSIAFNRHKLYTIFPLRKPITMRYVYEPDSEGNVRMLQHELYVESVDAAMFNSQNMATIKMQAPNPYFYISNNTTVDFTGIEGGLTFPIMSELLTPTEIFGEMRTETKQNVYYNGQIATGIKFTLDFSGPAAGISIYKGETGGVFSLNEEIVNTLTGSPFISGDRVTINTNMGYKTVTLLRAGDTYNIINCIGKYTEWFVIESGDNEFYYNVDQGIENISIKIEVTDTFEGV